MASGGRFFWGRLYHLLGEPGYRTGHRSAKVGAWLDALANSNLLLTFSEESGGAPEVSKLHKVYPADPVIARLASPYSTALPEPSPSQQAEAELAMATFRSVVGGSIARVGMKGVPVSPAEAAKCV